MTTKTRDDYLVMAKELTGSDNVPELIRAAKELERYFSEKKPPIWVPQDLPGYLPLFNICHPIHGTVPFKTYDFQDRLAWDLTRYVTNLNENPFVVSHARQMGMSTLMSALMTWHAQANRRSKSIVLSWQYAMSLEILDRVRFALPTLPPLYGQATEQTKGKITFSNGSTIEAGTYTSDSVMDRIIETDYDLIIMDSASSVPHGQSDRMEKLLETSKANKIIVSTPRDAKGFFYEQWKAAAPSHRRLIKWRDHPDRDDNWAQPYRAQLSEKQFRQEFECEFVSEE